MEKNYPRDEIFYLDDLILRLQEIKENYGNVKIKNYFNSPEESFIVEDKIKNTEYPVLLCAFSLELK